MTLSFNTSPSTSQANQAQNQDWNLSSHLKTLQPFYENAEEILADLVSVSNPDLPVTDPHLRLKLVEALANPDIQDLINPLATTSEGIAAITTYLTEGLKNLSGQELSILAQFLEDIQDSEVSVRLGLSETQVECLKQLQDDLPPINYEEVEMAKSIRTTLREQAGVNSAEQVFRDRAYLINPEDAQVTFEVNKLYASGVLNREMSDQEVSEALLAYVQQNFRYIKEPNDKDTVAGDYWQSVRETLAKGGGDCEDLSVLLASMLSNVLHTKQGYSLSQVSEMVTLSAGYITVDDTLKSGHTLVKLKNPETQQTVALDATSKHSLVPFEEINFEEILEMNSQVFIKYQAITDSFVTSTDASLNFDILLRYDGMFGAATGGGVGSADAYNANKNTLVWKINNEYKQLRALIAQPLNIPVLFNGGLYRQPTITELLTELGVPGLDMGGTEPDTAQASDPAVLAYQQALAQIETDRNTLMASVLPGSGGLTAQQLQDQIQSTQNSLDLARRELTEYISNFGRRPSDPVYISLNNNVNNLQSGVDTLNQQLQDSIGTQLAALDTRMQTATDTFNDSYSPPPTDTSLRVPPRFARSVSREEANNSGGTLYAGQRVAVNNAEDLKRLVEKMQIDEREIQDLNTQIDALKLQQQRPGNRERIQEQIDVLYTRRKAIQNGAVKVFKIIGDSTLDTNQMELNLLGERSTATGGLQAENFANFDFFHVKVTELEMNLQGMSFEGSSGGYTGNSISGKVQTILLKGDQFYLYTERVRQHMNRLAIFFHMANGVLEMNLNTAREIHDSALTGEQAQAAQKIRQSDKMLSKTSQLVNKLQSKVMDGVDKVAEQLFSFARSSNQAAFARKELDVEMWARSATDGGVGGFVGSFVAGAAAEFTDEMTGAISYTRARGKEEIHRLLVETSTFNSLETARYMQLVTQGEIVNGERIGGIDLWARNTSETFNHDHVHLAEHKDSALYMGEKIWKLMSESDTAIQDNVSDNIDYSKAFIKNFQNSLGHAFSYNSSGNRAVVNSVQEESFFINQLYRRTNSSYNDISVLGGLYDVSRGLEYNHNVNSLNSENLFHKAKGEKTGQLGDASLNKPQGKKPPAFVQILNKIFPMDAMKNSIINPMKSAFTSFAYNGLNGSPGMFIDYNMEKMAEFRNRQTRFQIALYIALMTKTALLEKKIEVAKEISGDKGTSSTSAVLKISEQALEAELAKQTRSFESFHQEAINLVASTNKLIKTRAEYYKSFAKMPLKSAKTAASIAIFVAAKPIATSIVSTIVGLAANPLNPVGFAIGQFLQGLGMGVLPEPTTGFMYWNYLWTALGTTALETLTTGIESALENSVAEYQDHTTLFRDNITDLTGVDRGTQGNKLRFGYANTIDQINTYNSRVTTALDGAPNLLENTFAVRDQSSGKLSDYYSNKLASILYQGRTEYNAVLPGNTYTNGFNTYALDNVAGLSAPDLAKLGITSTPGLANNTNGVSFIENKGNGYYAYNGMLGAFKAKKTANYKNLIKRHLLVLKALYDAIENELAYMFNKQKPGGMSRFDGGSGFSVIDSILNAETSLSQDLRTELNTFLLPGWNSNAQKDQTQTSLDYATMQAFFSFVPGAALAILPYGTGELAQQGFDLAIDKIDQSRKYLWGPFSGVHAEYHKSNTISDRERVIAYLEKSFAQDTTYNLQAANGSYNVFENGNPNNFLLGGEDIWNYLNATSTSDYYAARGFAQVLNPGAFNTSQDIPRVTQENTTTEELESRVKRYSPYFVMDELEKNVLSTLYHGGKFLQKRSLDKSKIRADKTYTDQDEQEMIANADANQNMDSGYFTVSSDDSYKFIDKASTALEYQQVEYVTLIQAQQRLNRIATMRMMYIMLEQALYAQRQNVLREMFGISSSSGILQTTMTIVDNYNNAQFEILGELTQEMLARVDSKNTHYQNTIDGSIEAAATAMIIPMVYNRYKAVADPTGSGGVRYKSLAQHTIMMAGKVAIYKLIAKFVVGLMALLSAKPVPTMRSKMATYDENNPTDATDEDKIKESKGQETGKLTTGQKTQKTTEQKESNLLRGSNDGMGPQMANPAMQFGGSNLSFSARGQFTVNKGILTQAQTQLKQKFRKIQLLRELAMQLQDAKLDAAAEISGSQQSGAHKGLLNIINKVQSSESKVLEHMFSALKASAEARNRGMEMIRAAAVEFISQKIASKASAGEKKDKSKKNAKKGATKVKKGMLHKLAKMLGINKLFEKNPFQAGQRLSNAANRNTPKPRTTPTRAQRMKTSIGNAFSKLGTKISHAWNKAFKGSDTKQKSASGKTGPRRQGEKTTGKKMADTLQNKKMSSFLKVLGILSPLLGALLFDAAIAMGSAIGGKGRDEMMSLDSATAFAEGGDGGEGGSADGDVVDTGGLENSSVMAEIAQGNIEIGQAILKDQIALNQSGAKVLNKIKAAIKENIKKKQEKDAKEKFSQATKDMIANMNRDDSDKGGLTAEQKQALVFEGSKGLWNGIKFLLSGGIGKTIGKPSSTASPSQQDKGLGSKIWGGFKTGLKYTVGGISAVVGSGIKTVGTILKATLSLPIFLIATVGNLANAALGSVGLLNQSTDKHGNVDATSDVAQQAKTGLKRAGKDFSEMMLGKGDNAFILSKGIRGIVNVFRGKNKTINGISRARKEAGENQARLAQLTTNQATLTQLKQDQGRMAQLKSKLEAQDPTNPITASELSELEKLEIDQKDRSEKIETYEGEKEELEKLKSADGKGKAGWKALGHSVGKSLMQNFIYNPFGEANANQKTGASQDTESVREFKLNLKKTMTELELHDKKRLARKAANLDEGDSAEYFRMTLGQQNAMASFVARLDVAIEDTQKLAETSTEPKTKETLDKLIALRKKANAMGSNIVHEADIVEDVQARARAEGQPVPTRGEILATLGGVKGNGLEQIGKANEGAFRATEQLFGSKREVSNLFTQAEQTAGVNKYVSGLVQDAVMSRLTTQAGAQQVVQEWKELTAELSDLEDVVTEEIINAPEYEGETPLQASQTVTQEMTHVDDEIQRLEEALSHVEASVGPRPEERAMLDRKEAMLLATKEALELRQVAITSSLSAAEDEEQDDAASQSARRIAELEAELARIGNEDTAHVDPDRLDMAESILQQKEAAQINSVNISKRMDDLAATSGINITQKLKREALFSDLQNSTRKTGVAGISPLGKSMVMAVLRGGQALPSQAGALDATTLSAIQAFEFEGNAGQKAKTLATLSQDVDTVKTAADKQAVIQKYGLDKAGITVDNFDVGMIALAESQGGKLTDDGAEMFAQTAMPTQTLSLKQQYMKEAFEASPVSLGAKTQFEVLGEEIAEVDHKWNFALRAEKSLRASSTDQQFTEAMDAAKRAGIKKELAELKALPAPALTGMSAAEYTALDTEFQDNADELGQIGHELVQIQQQRAALPADIPSPKADLQDQLDTLRERKKALASIAPEPVVVPKSTSKPESALVDRVPDVVDRVDERTKLLQAVMNVGGTSKETTSPIEDRVGNKNRLLKETGRLSGSMAENVAQLEDDYRLATLAQIVGEGQEGITNAYLNDRARHHLDKMYPQEDAEAYNAKAAKDVSGDFFIQLQKAGVINQYGATSEDFNVLDDKQKRRVLSDVARNVTKGYMDPTAKKALLSKLSEDIVQVNEVRQATQADKLKSNGFSDKGKDEAYIKYMQDQIAGLEKLEKELAKKDTESATALRAIIENHKKVVKHVTEHMQKASEKSSDELISTLQRESFHFGNDREQIDQRLGQRELRRGQDINGTVFDMVEALRNVDATADRRLAKTFIQNVNRKHDNMALLESKGQDPLSARIALMEEEQQFGTHLAREMEFGSSKHAARELLEVATGAGGSERDKKNGFESAVHILHKFQIESPELAGQLESEMFKQAKTSEERAVIAKLVRKAAVDKGVAGQLSEGLNEPGWFRRAVNPLLGVFGVGEDVRNLSTIKNMRDIYEHGSWNGVSLAGSALVQGVGGVFTTGLNASANGAYSKASSERLANVAKYSSYDELQSEEGRHFFSKLGQDQKNMLLETLQTEALSGDIEARMALKKLNKVGIKHSDDLMQFNLDSFSSRLEDIEVISKDRRKVLQESPERQVQALSTVLIPDPKVNSSFGITDLTDTFKEVNPAQRAAEAKAALPQIQAIINRTLTESAAKSPDKKTPSQEALNKVNEFLNLMYQSSDETSVINSGLQIFVEQDVDEFFEELAVGIKKDHVQVLTLQTGISEGGKAFANAAERTQDLHAIPASLDELQVEKSQTLAKLRELRNGLETSGTTFVEEELTDQFVEDITDQLAVSLQYHDEEITEEVAKISALLGAAKPEQTTRDFAETLGKKIQDINAKTRVSSLKVDFKEFVKRVADNKVSEDNTVQDRLESGYHVGGYAAAHMLSGMSVVQKHHAIAKAMTSSDTGKVEAIQDVISDQAISDPSSTAVLVSSLDQIESVFGENQPESTLQLNHMQQVVKHTQQSIKKHQYSKQKLQNLRSFYTEVASNALAGLSEKNRTPAHLLTPKQVVTGLKVSQERIEELSKTEADRIRNRDEIEQLKGIVALSQLYLNAIDNLELTDKYLNKLEVPQKSLEDGLKDVQGYQEVAKEDAPLFATHATSTQRKAILENLKTKVAPKVAVSVSAAEKEMSKLQQQRHPDKAALDKAEKALKAAQGRYSQLAQTMEALEASINPSVVFIQDASKGVSHTAPLGSPYVDASPTGKLQSALNEAEKELTDVLLAADARANKNTYERAQLDALKAGVDTGFSGGVTPEFRYDSISKAYHENKAALTIREQQKFERALGLVRVAENTAGITVPATPTTGPISHNTSDVKRGRLLTEVFHRATFAESIQHLNELQTSVGASGALDAKVSELSMMPVDGTAPADHVRILNEELNFFNKVLRAQLDPAVGLDSGVSDWLYANTDQVAQLLHKTDDALKRTDLTPQQRKALHLNQAQLKDQLEKLSVAGASTVTTGTQATVFLKGRFELMLQAYQHGKAVKYEEDMRAPMKQYITDLTIDPTMKGAILSRLDTSPTVDAFMKSLTVAETGVLFGADSGLVQTLNFGPEELEKLEKLANEAKNTADLSTMLIPAGSPPGTPPVMPSVTALITLRNNPDKQALYLKTLMAIHASAPGTGYPGQVGADLNLVATGPVNEVLGGVLNGNQGTLDASRAKLFKLLSGDEISDAQKQHVYLMIQALNPEFTETMLTQLSDTVNPELIEAGLGIPSAQAAQVFATLQDVRIIDAYGRPTTALIEDFDRSVAALDRQLTAQGIRVDKRVMAQFLKANIKDVASTRQALLETLYRDISENPTLETSSQESALKALDLAIKKQERRLHGHFQRISDNAAKIEKRAIKGNVDMKHYLSDTQGLLMGLKLDVMPELGMTADSEFEAYLNSSQSEVGQVIGLIELLEKMENKKVGDEFIQNRIKQSKAALESALLKMIHDGEIELSEDEKKKVATLSMTLTEPIPSWITGKKDPDPTSSRVKSDRVAHESGMKRVYQVTQNPRLALSYVEGLPVESDRSAALSAIGLSTETAFESVAGAKKMLPKAQEMLNRIYKETDKSEEATFEALNHFHMPSEATALEKQAFWSNLSFYQNSAKTNEDLAYFLTKMPAHLRPSFEEFLKTQFKEKSESNRPTKEATLEGIRKAEQALNVQVKNALADVRTNTNALFAQKMLDIQSGKSEAVRTWTLVMEELSKGVLQGDPADISAMTTIVISLGAMGVRGTANPHQPTTALQNVVVPLVQNSVGKSALMAISNTEQGATVLSQTYIESQANNVTRSEVLRELSRTALAVGTLNQIYESSSPSVRTETTLAAMQGFQMPEKLSASEQNAFWDELALMEDVKRMPDRESAMDTLGYIYGKLPMHLKPSFEMYLQHLGLETDEVIDVVDRGTESVRLATEIARFPSFQWVSLIQADLPALEHGDEQALQKWALVIEKLAEQYEVLDRSPDPFHELLYFLANVPTAPHALQNLLQKTLQNEKTRQTFTAALSADKDRLGGLEFHSHILHNLLPEPTPLPTGGFVSEAMDREVLHQLSQNSVVCHEAYVRAKYAAENGYPVTEDTLYLACQYFGSTEAAPKVYTGEFGPLSFNTMKYLTEVAMAQKNTQSIAPLLKHQTETRWGTVEERHIQALHQKYQALNTSAYTLSAMDMQASMTPLVEALNELGHSEDEDMYDYVLDQLAERTGDPNFVQRFVRFHPNSCMVDIGKVPAAPLDTLRSGSYAYLLLQQECRAAQSIVPATGADQQALDERWHHIREMVDIFSSNPEMTIELTLSLMKDPSIDPQMFAKHVLANPAFLQSAGAQKVGILAELIYQGMQDPRIKPALVGLLDTGVEDAGKAPTAKVVKELIGENLLRSGDGVQNARSFFTALQVRGYMDPTDNLDFLDDPDEAQYFAEKLQTLQQTNPALFASIVENLTRGSTFNEALVRMHAGHDPKQKEAYKDIVLMVAMYEPEIFKSMLTNTTPVGRTSLSDILTKATPASEPTISMVVERAKRAAPAVNDASARGTAFLANVVADGGITPKKYAELMSDEPLRTAFLKALANTIKQNPDTLKEPWFQALVNPSSSLDFNVTPLKELLAVASVDSGAPAAKTILRAVIVQLSPIDAALKKLNDELDRETDPKKRTAILRQINKLNSGKMKPADVKKLAPSPLSKSEFMSLYSLIQDTDSSLLKDPKIKNQLATGYLDVLNTKNKSRSAMVKAVVADKISGNVDDTLSTIVLEKLLDHSHLSGEKRRIAIKQDMETLKSLANTPMTDKQSAEFGKIVGMFLQRNQQALLEQNFSVRTPMAQLLTNQLSKGNGDIIEHILVGISPPPFYMEPDPALMNFMVQSLAEATNDYYSKFSEIRLPTTYVAQHTALKAAYQKALENPDSASGKFFAQYAVRAARHNQDITWMYKAALNFRVDRSEQDAARISVNARNHKLSKTHLKALAEAGVVSKVERTEGGAARYLIQHQVAKPVTAEEIALVTPSLAKFRQKGVADGVMQELKTQNVVDANGQVDKTKLATLKYETLGDYIEKNFPGISYEDRVNLTEVLVRNGVVDDAGNLTSVAQNLNTPAGDPILQKIKSDLKEMVFHANGSQGPKVAPWVADRFSRILDKDPTDPTRLTLGEVRAAQAKLQQEYPGLRSYHDFAALHSHLTQVAEQQEKDLGTLAKAIYSTTSDSETDARVIAHRAELLEVATALNRAFIDRGSALDSVEKKYKLPKGSLAETVIQQGFVHRGTLFIPEDATLDLTGIPGLTARQRYHIAKDAKKALAAEQSKRLAMLAKIGTADNGRLMAAPPSYQKERGESPRRDNARTPVLWEVDGNHSTVSENYLLTYIKAQKDPYIEAQMLNRVASDTSTAETHLSQWMKRFDEKDSRHVARMLLNPALSHEARMTILHIASKESQDKTRRLVSGAASTPTSVLLEELHTEYRKDRSPANTKRFNECLVAMFENDPQGFTAYYDALPDTSTTKLSKQYLAELGINPRELEQTQKRLIREIREQQLHRKSTTGVIKTGESVLDDLVGKFADPNDPTSEVMSPVGILSSLITVERKYPHLVPAGTSKQYVLDLKKEADAQGMSITGYLYMKHGGMASSEHYEMIPDLLYATGADIDYSNEYGFTDEALRPGPKIQKFQQALTANKTRLAPGHPDRAALMANPEMLFDAEWSQEDLAFIHYRLFDQQGNLLMGQFNALFATTIGSGPDADRNRDGLLKMVRMMNQLHIVATATDRKTLDGALIDVFTRNTRDLSSEHKRHMFNRLMASTGLREKVHTQIATHYRTPDGKPVQLVSLFEFDVQSYTALASHQGGDKSAQQSAQRNVLRSERYHEATAREAFGESVTPLKALATRSDFSENVALVFDAFNQDMVAIDRKYGPGPLSRADEESRINDKSEALSRLMGELAEANAVSKELQAFLPRPAVDKPASESGRGKFESWEYSQKVPAFRPKRALPDFDLGETPSDVEASQDHLRFKDNDGMMEEFE